MTKTQVIYVQHQTVSLPLA